MISLIFSTHNGAETLPLMLDSLCRLVVNEPWEVIAINNASTDATQTILNNYQSKLPLALLVEPVPGKNRALNRATQIASGDLLVFTDDDIIADQAWLLALRKATNSHSDFAVFGGRILPYWLSPPPSAVLKNAPLGVTYALTPDDQKTGPIFPGLVWGPNMAVRRGVFDAGHQFDQSVGPTHGDYVMGSETEFTLRVARHGYASWFEDSALVQHIIRPHQLDPNWVIMRAYRFGRGQWVQLGGTEPGTLLFGVPRWRFSSFACHALQAMQARLRGDEDSLFKARWEMSFLRGYLTEAWHRIHLERNRYPEG